jgi:ElaB/YqjD/DUF883 family membrane-anchored ribosome-binding protein
MAEHAAARMGGTVDEMSEKAQQMPDRAREMAYQAVDSGRENTAAMLETAAERLGERTDMSGSRGIQGMAAEKAAQGLQEAAGYLREHEAAEIWQDVEGYVKQHPGRSVLMAVGAGLLVGRILR